MTTASRCVVVIGASLFRFHSLMEWNDISGGLVPVVVSGLYVAFGEDDDGDRQGGKDSTCARRFPQCWKWLASKIALQLRSMNLRSRDSKIRRTSGLRLNSCWICGAAMLHRSDWSHSDEMCTNKFCWASGLADRFQEIMPGFSSFSVNCNERANINLLSSNRQFEKYT